MDEPTWLAVLGVVGLGTIVSAGINGWVSYKVLGAQNRASDDRAKVERDHDAAQRQADRDAERERLEGERRESLEDHWRAERQEAHVRLLALFERGGRQVRDAVHSLLYDHQNGVYTKGDSEKAFAAEFNREIAEALSRVNIYCGRASISEAITCWTTLHRLNEDAFFAAVFIGAEAPPPAEFKQKLELAYTQVDKYTLAVRAELGTGD